MTGERRFGGRGWVVLLALLGLLALPAAGQEEFVKPSESDCAICHDDVGAALEWTPHGGEAFVQLPKQGGQQHCQICHGEGTEHMEEAEPELIDVPRGVDQHRLCLTCHDAQLHAPTLGASAHAGNAIYCTDCHDVHPDEPAENQQQSRLLRSEPERLCGECHAAQVADFRRPHAHRLAREGDPGGIQCFSCHDPHGGKGERSLAQDRLGAGPCETCHTETRGPFVFPHVNRIVGGCTSCHEPHGSNNPKQLTRHRVEQLCLECHTNFPGGTLGSQPPSFHDLRSARFRSCTTCHVAIHGSNSSPALLK